MALSAEARRILGIAMGDKVKGEEVADAVDAQAAVVAAVATPATATAEDVANTLNEVIAALQAAGLMASA